MCIQTHSRNKTPTMDTMDAMDTIDVTIRPLDPEDDTLFVTQMLLSGFRELDSAYMSLFLSRRKTRCVVFVLAAVIYPVLLAFQEADFYSASIYSHLISIAVSTELSYLAIWYYVRGKVQDNHKRYRSSMMKDMRDPCRYYNEEKGRCFWVAACGSTILGTIAMDVTEDPGTVELRRLCVSPLHRRKKIGSILVDTLETYAMEQGHIKVTLSNIEVQTASHRLYESKGYTKKSEDTFDMESMFTELVCYVFEKQLVDEDKKND